MSVFTSCMARSMNDTPSGGGSRSMVTLSPVRNETPLPVSLDFTRLLRLLRLDAVLEKRKGGREERLIS